MNGRAALTFTLLASAALVIVVIAVSLIAGPVMGSRVSAFRVPLETSIARVGESSITITLHNNELYDMRALVWYTLRDPRSGVLFYTAPAVEVEVVPSRDSIAVSLPVPAEIVAGDWRLETFVSEQVAYVDERLLPRTTLAQQLAVAGADKSAILGAALEPLDDGSYYLSANIILRDQDLRQPRDLRFAISLNAVEQTPDGAVLMLERVLLTPFAAVTLNPNNSLTRRAESGVMLPAGDYVVTLWVQSANERGGFEHYAQHTYPHVFSIEGEATP